jgi:O-antigen/teichoic acid export membrane protein
MPPGERRMSLTAIGSKIAAGAAWMIALRVIERSIGMISTIILARLLVPQDFGLVAMAMAVYALIEVAGQFGFDLILIRAQRASRAQYDGAWTLGVCHGVVSALVLLALAEPTAGFFSEPRLVPVIQILAAVAFLQGLENIGVVDFRRDFHFGKDFLFLFGKKIISFAVTVTLAFHYRSYWALVIGIVTSRVSGVILSYLLHPYRPRLSFSEIPNLFGFSRWVLLTRILGFVSMPARWVCTAWEGRSPRFPPPNCFIRSCAPSSPAMPWWRTMPPR